jgi:hypothetical protein
MTADGGGAATFSARTSVSDWRTTTGGDACLGVGCAKFEASPGAFASIDRRSGGRSVWVTETPATGSIIRSSWTSTKSVASGAVSMAAAGTVVVTGTAGGGVEIDG